MSRLVPIAAAIAWMAAGKDPSAVSPRRPSAQAVSAPDPAEAIDLGTLGGNSATPRALNNAGQVVGMSVAADGEAHPFVWEGGTMRQLPLLPGMRPGFPFPEIGGDAQAISNTGLVAGLSYNRYDARMVLWDSTGVHDLAAPTVYGLPISRFARVIRITDEGNILATVVLHSGPPPTSYPVLWQGGIPQRLPALYAWDQRYTAAAMNSRGQVIGAAASAYGYEGDRYRHPVLWTDGAIQDLGVLRAGGDTPYCYDPIYPPAGLWSDGVMTDLGLGPLGGAASIAIAVNARGDVLGASGTPLYPRSPDLSATSPSRGILWPRH